MRGTPVAGGMGSPLQRPSWSQSMTFPCWAVRACFLGVLVAAAGTAAAGHPETMMPSCSRLAVGHDSTPENLLRGKTRWPSSCQRQQHSTDSHAENVESPQASYGDLPVAEAFSKPVVI